MRVFLALGLALVLSCRTKEPAPSGTPKPAEPLGMGMARVGSAAFHLEIGGVHERFQDAKGAIEHLTQAVSKAEDGAQRAHALAALARVKEGAGDRDGAIEALERARGEIAKLAVQGPAGAPAHAAPMGPGPAGDDLLLQLVRLQAEKGRTDEALRLSGQGLAVARAPWQREQLQRLEVDLLRKAGTLEKRIAESEKALDAPKPDEAPLRFLVAALAGDAMPGPEAPGGAPGQPQPVSSKLIRALERLHELHPEDPQLRQTLLSSLERAGRIDDAVKMVLAAPRTNAMECAMGAGPQSVPAAIEGLAEAARIRARAGQKEKALAEVARIAALAKREGVSAYLVAADLYREQGAAARAAEMVRRAGAEARSPGDRRRVAFARERSVPLAADRNGLESLYAEWERSADPCMRRAAAERRALRATMTAGPMPMPGQMPPPGPMPPPNPTNMTPQPAPR